MKHVELYTDGACKGNPGRGGYGVVLLYKQFRKELSGGYRRTTNNRMEILAAVRGLEALTEPCEVTLYSDSRYVVDAWSKNWIGNWIRHNWIKSDRTPVGNRDLWTRLLQAAEKHQLRFVWVKGHASNPENNRCDELACSAALSDSIGEDSGYSVTDGAPCGVPPR